MTNICAEHEAKPYDVLDQCPYCYIGRLEAAVIDLSKNCRANRSNLKPENDILLGKIIMKDFLQSGQL